MIRLKRLNNSEIVVNSDMIETMEETPDLVITLTSGRKIVVNERLQDVINRIIEYKCRLNHLKAVE